MQMFEDAGTMPPPPKRVAVSTCEAEPSASDSDVSPQAALTLTPRFASVHLATTLASTLMQTSLEKEADTNAALTDTFTDVWHDQSKSRWAPDEQVLYLPCGCMGTKFCIRLIHAIPFALWIFDRCTYKLWLSHVIASALPQCPLVCTLCSRITKIVAIRPYAFYALSQLH